MKTKLNKQSKDYTESTSIEIGIFLLVLFVLKALTYKHIIF